MINELMADFKGSIADAANELENRTQKLLESEWEVGFRDRGMGHGDYAVITKYKGKTIVVCECPSLQIAQFIVNLKKK
jgi:hypothetical protein